MCDQDEFRRMIIKIGEGVPTIPVSADHRNGDWLDTDIYEGEWYMDSLTGKLYTRYGNSIDQTVGSFEWGSIGGTLTDQLDLVAALATKQNQSAILTALSGLDGTTGYVVQTGASSFARRTLMAPVAGFIISNADGVAGNSVFVLANDLAALEALSGTGIPVRTGSDTWVQRQMTAPVAGLTITNPAGIAGNFTFALADDLAAIEAIGGFGIIARTASNTWTVRAIVAPAAGITITNAAGIAGDMTIALSNDLAAIEALAGTGIAVRTGSDTWAVRAVVAPSAGITVTNPSGIAGDVTLVLANDLAALEALASTGFAVRTGTDAWAQRTITGTALQIIVTNGNAVSGNPVLSLDQEIIDGSSVFRPATTTNSIRTKANFGFNDATGILSFCTGGRSALFPNLAAGICSSVHGGAALTARGQYDGMLGGYNNQTLATSGGGNTGMVGGTGNTSEGANSVMNGGNGNVHQVTAVNSVTNGGTNNVVSAEGAVVHGGNGNNAATIYSTVQGIGGISTNPNERVHSITSKAQSGTVMMSLITTGNVTTSMNGSDGVAGIAINPGESWLIEGYLIGTITSATNRGSSRGYNWTMRIKNVAGVMTFTTISTTMDVGDTGMTGVGVITDNVGGGRYNIRVAGIAATTIQWAATINYTQIMFI